MKTLQKKERPSDLSICKEMTIIIQLLDLFQNNP